MLGIARDAAMPGSDKALAPINRLGRPEEVAKLIAYLISDDSSYTTGAIYTIDGGMTP
jgi:NAD(P)-dependent dehydrogenase (short-subunit alcohol dehydrogenase family)